MEKNFAHKSIIWLFISPFRKVGMEVRKIWKVLGEGNSWEIGKVMKLVFVRQKI